MIDLTPLDVRKKRGDFRKILRGYDPVEVDTFLELVEDRLEALVMENLALSEKTSRLETSLNALEQREKAVQEALVSAQKLREEVGEQSRREVDLLRREAQGEADRMRRDAQAEVERLRRSAELDAERKILEVEGLIRDRQRSLEEMERNRRKFLKAFRTLLERELDAVEVEEQRLPLEEAPIELELRGWRPPTEAWLHLPAAGAEEEPVTEEASEGPAGAEPRKEPADEEAADEPAGEPALQPAASAEVMAVDEETDFDGELLAEEPETASTESEPPLLSSAAPYEGEEDLGGEHEEVPPEEARPWGAGRAVQEGVGSEPAAQGTTEALSPEDLGDDASEETEPTEEEPDPPPTLPEEPLWLSSLLKREGFGEKKPEE